ncbi:MAG: CDP-alcohol phosphatidyltransferase family protein, partial [Phycisphaerales bacterium]|nr:CDP-alcohol phosphatidyltransferase family protein [Phycisphaerales bacterium]
GGGGDPSEVPLRKLIPNLLTCVAMCCGLAAVHFAIQKDFDKALTAIALSAVFDMLDGRAARLLRATSEFGSVLDSLSDFLSFGVAPAVLLYQSIFAAADLRVLGRDASILGLLAMMAYVLCAGLRLARFTAAAKTPEKKAWPLAGFFMGMPTPAAAGCVLIPLLLSQSKIIAQVRDGPLELPGLVVLLNTLLIAGMMIGRQPMYSLKTVRVKRWMAVPLLAGVALLAVAAVRDLWLAVSLACGAYLATTPVAWARYRRLRKKAEVQA